VEIIQALLLGIVQGLTEFLPISSSAHLIVVRLLIGGPEPALAFDLALHLGTLVAVLTFFWRDLFGMALALPRALLAGRLLHDPEARLALLILAGSVPAGLVGLIFGDLIEAVFHQEAGLRQSLVIIALMLMVLAVLLWVVERQAEHRRDIKDLTWADTVLIGAAQALALVPGVSRSGSTITAGLWLGLTRPAAARYSFLLGTPIILLAGLKEGVAVVQAGLLAATGLPFVVGFLASAVVGYLCIKFLIQYLQFRTMTVFVVYRLIVGGGLLLFSLTR
jgi:undecaprenyl-diphosphatase